MIKQNIIFLIYQVLYVVVSRFTGPIQILHFARNLVKFVRHAQICSLVVGEQPFGNSSGFCINIVIDGSGLFVKQFLCLPVVDFLCPIKVFLLIAV